MADFLRGLGHNVVRVEDFELKGSSDDALIEWASRDERIVITWNYDDFKPGRAWRRCGGVIGIGSKVSIRRAKEILKKALEDHPEAFFVRSFVTISQDGIRKVGNIG